MLDLKAEEALAGAISTGDSQLRALRAAPHQALECGAAICCWAAAVSAPRLNLKRNGSHGTPLECKLWRCALALESWPWRGLCWRPRRRVRWFPTPFLPQFQGTECCWFRHCQAPLGLLRLGQAPPPEDAARLASLTVQFCRTDPSGWVLLAEAQLRSDNPPWPAFPWPGPRSSTPQSPHLVRTRGSIALRHGPTLEQAVGLLQTGPEIRWKERRRLLSIWATPTPAAEQLPTVPGRLSGPRLGARAKTSGRRFNNQAWCSTSWAGVDAARSRLAPLPEDNATALSRCWPLATASAHRRRSAKRPQRLASEPLCRIEPNYVLECLSKEQLWGERLAPQRPDPLLSQPELKSAVVPSETPMPRQHRFWRRGLARGAPERGKRPRPAAHLRRDSVGLRPVPSQDTRPGLAEERVLADCSASGDCAAPTSSTP